MEEQLRALQERNQMNLSMGPYEKKLLFEKELYKKLIKAKSTQQHAPEEVKKAEEQYYLYRDGEDGYKSHKRRKYQQEAIELKKEMMKKIDDNNKEFDTLIPTCETQQIYLKNISTIQSSLLKEIQRKVNEIQLDMTNSDTNYRKSYYLELEQKNIESWIRFCNYTLIVLLVLYIHNNAYKETHFGIWLGAACIFIVITLLTPLIKWTRSIPTNFNVYTEWGYSPELPRTPILWSIVSVLLFIYISIWSYDHIELINQTITRWYYKIITFDFSIRMFS
jgi:hypothetical protein